MSGHVFSVEDGNLFCDGKYVANGFIHIQSAYAIPGQNTPAVVCGILQTASGRQIDLCLPVQQWRTRTIQSKCQYFACNSPKRFDLYLADQLDRSLPGNTSDLKENTVPIGTLLSTPGLHRLPYGSICAVAGNIVIGTDNANILLDNHVRNLCILDGEENPLCKLFRILLTQPPAVTLAASLAFFSVIRSDCLQEADFQGVGYIVGPSSVGKTYLAKCLFGFIGERGATSFRPVYIFESQTSIAGFLNAMSEARDLPIVLDDIAISSSRNSQRKRADLAANIIREGANAAKFVKSEPGNQRREVECQSTVIITAEFPIPALSELNRCILIPITRPLTLPAELTPKLMGSSILAFLRYFTTLYNSGGQLTQVFPLDSSILPTNTPTPDRRVLNNLSILATVMRAALHAAKQEGLEESECQQLQNLLLHSIQQSLHAHHKEKERILSTIPIGNLPRIILKGLRENAFNLKNCKRYKKLKKLPPCDGIWWKDSLCLLPKALEVYIQRQPGYHNYSTKQIGKELARLDLLHLHHEPTYTVKIHDSFPRVYRIKQARLEETAEEFFGLSLGMNLH